MNLLGKSLLSAYRKTETSHIIYDQAPFYRRGDVILGFVSICILVMMFLFKLPEMYLFPVFAFLLVTIYVILNYDNSKRMLKKEIIEKIVPLKMWSSYSELQIHRMKIYQDSLIAQNMLFGNIKDLDLLKEYSEYTKNESEYTKDNTGIIYSGIGGLLVMFAFPIWGYSVGEIIKDAVSSGNIIETYKLLAAYLTIISICIAFIIFLKKSADSYYNSLSYKYLSILRFNEQLRINLKRKYMIENNAS